MNRSSLSYLKVLNRSAAMGALENITATFKARRLAVLAALAAVLSSSATVAVATPPEGIVSATVFAGPAGFADRTDLKFRIKKEHGQEVISVKRSEDTVIQQVIIAPAGHTGWHTHPGPVVVLIMSGTLSFYDGEDPTCTARTYSAGEAFVDSGQGHVHIARNEGSENLELWAIYFDVPADGIFRIDAPSPGNCPF
jgi:quercetin dioxygenase-like cupin family protein